MYHLDYLKDQGPPSREQQLERTDSRDTGGVRLGATVKGAVHAGESLGLETRGQEESRLQ